MQKELKFLLESFVAWDSIQPILVSEESLIDWINFLNKSELYSSDELRGDVIANIYLFETEEKTFKIEKSREIIEKSSMKPQGDFNIFILREIDKFTDQAANALLKILEDVPPRVIFFLTTNAKENIIETIRSRILYFWSDQVRFEVTDRQRSVIDEYFSWNKPPLLNYMLQEKILKHDDWTSWIKIDKVLDWIKYLYSTNANARYIMDRVILDL